METNLTKGTSIKSDGEGVGNKIKIFRQFLGLKLGQYGNGVGSKTEKSKGTNMNNSP